MYEKFFSLSHRPFAAAPNLECLVAHRGYVDARDRVLRCLTDGAGTAVLTAPAGLGKSLLCQDLQTQLRGRFTVAYLCSAQFPSRKALLQAILFELGVDYLGLSEDEARLGVRKAAQESADKGRGLVLIVDEAHLMPTELLQELRTIAEPSLRCPSPPRLMLAGQLELEERLANHDLQSLNDRISCHAILEPLTQVESAEYIQERLAVAGATTPKFSEEALAFIVRASDGNPRCLNQLCDHCLLSSYTIEERPVLLETARNSLEDLRALPLHWNDAGLADEVQSSDEVDEADFDDADSFEPAAQVDEVVEDPIDAHEAAAEESTTTNFWNDSSFVSAFEVGGEQPEAPSSSDAVLFGSPAPWPAVPVTDAIDPEVSLTFPEIGAASSVWDEIEVDSSIESITANPSEAESFQTAEAGEELSTDDEATLLYQPQLSAQYQIEPEFEDEELVVDDRYAALDRASEALSTYLPQAPELLKFLSQYSVSTEPRAAATEVVEPQSMAVMEPETREQELELLETIRELQEQLRRATAERPKVADPEESWKVEPVYDIVEPPEAQQAVVSEPAPVFAPEPVIEHRPIEEPVAVVVAAPIAESESTTEPARSRFAQLFSRMRQKRREVEDRLRKNADWI